MARLSVFEQVSVDGYFVDRHGDMSWAKGRRDEEFDAFVEGNAAGGSTLVFGRVTYEMMASFWPTNWAASANPVVAERMNALPKIVFSRTLGSADWHNTRLVRSDLIGEIERLKGRDSDLAVLGSGSIVAQLAEADLVDEYQIVVFPLVLGGGRSMFEGQTRRFGVEPLEVRRFHNGCVLLRYEPARQ
ncbi:hypothetical protein C3941_20825 [Kaistia algarum]|uniref:dihydrofolate reductase family protein n=1 Tax=Kaistia algarum TaxID=2083279 RepID=UPI000CE79F7A|nr:dihydrofolate reductase family protein [Kaistia algarum]MCX5516058.1 dihydrofolate reductase family protein [Kaistia algarum]PPE77983.1 hypothetical protein C3941_20825 [Kaistia algarum]